MQDIVLLPGLDGTGDLFDPLVAVIPSHFRVQVVRYATQQTQNLSQHVEQAIASVTEWDRKLVVAESFSSLVLLKLIERGIRPRGIVFCAGFACPPRPMLLSMASWFPLAAIMRLAPPPIALRLACLGWNASDELVQKTQEALASVDGAVLANRLRIVASTIISLTEVVTLPVLYLRAVSDRLVPRTAADWFITNARHITIKSIPGPHFLCQATPTKAWSTILEFHTSLPETARDRR